jgi:hypothetical protein
VIRLWHVPVRLATGALILDSGVKKWSEEGDQGPQDHPDSTATYVYPRFEDVESRTFTRMLATGEVLLGGALLMPLVQTGVAGVGLAALSTGLLGTYLGLPGLRRDRIRGPNRGSTESTTERTALAKDSWMLAVGMAWMIKSLADRRSAGAVRAGLSRSN